MHLTGDTEYCPGKSKALACDCSGQRCRARSSSSSGPAPAAPLFARPALSRGSPLWRKGRLRPIVRIFAVARVRKLPVACAPGLLGHLLTSLLAADVQGADQLLPILSAPPQAIQTDSEPAHYSVRGLTVPASAPALSPVARATRVSD